MTVYIGVDDGRPVRCARCGRDDVRGVAVDTGPGTPVVVRVCVRCGGRLRVMARWLTRRARGAR